MKNINKLYYAGLFFSLCLLFPVTAYGAAITNDVTTEAGIQFEKGQGPTKPVDPEEPGTEEPGSEGKDGSLIIVKVTPFDFGTVQLTTTPQNRFPVVTVQPNIQIADIRGANTGWYLTASMSSFENEDEEESLRGASLHILDGRLNSLVDDQYAPQVFKNIVMEADEEPVPIMTAANGKGMGLWVDRFYPDPDDLEEEDVYIFLDIPTSSIEVGIHKATISWLLSDTP